MIKSAAPTTLWRFVFIALPVVLLLAVASGVWASPGQSGLRQTVPTRTPTSAPPTDTPVTPADTAVMPTAQQGTDTPAPSTNTAVPATNTSVPATAGPEATRVPETEPQPSASVATAIQAAEATGTSAAEATTAAITSAGYPESGADLTPLIGAGSVLAFIISTGAYLLRRRP